MEDGEEGANHFDSRRWGEAAQVSEKRRLCQCPMRHMTQKGSMMMTGDNRLDFRDLSTEQPPPVYRIILWINSPCVQGHTTSSYYPAFKDTL